MTTVTQDGDTTITVRFRDAPEVVLRRRLKTLLIRQQRLINELAKPGGQHRQRICQPIIALDQAAGMCRALLARLARSAARR